jgi:hypothetical protein
MADSVVEKALDIIPEVGFDIQARVLPGAIILLTSTQLPLSAFNENPILSTIGLTALSYTVGFFADKSTVNIARLIENRCFFRLPKLRSQSGTFITEINSFAVTGIKSKPGRRLALKLLAESVLSRVMACYVICQFIASFDWIRGFAKTYIINTQNASETKLADLRFVHFPSLFAATASVFFIFCWYSVARNATKRIYELAHEDG